MYVKSVVLDGFKSYGQRTEITGWDPKFNAITGLNGSGKSNILDGICFLLGITNLSQVRATNLQELVYKNGQAGITKATVTITFDNKDRSQSPMGYESYDEITITRQVVVGGRNKYLINGSTVQNNRVQDLFRSVQLNVNNPHFLIMQGRVTKVLNMKPIEILGMIEEAAGTKMYESKKQQAIKTIEKKNAKLREIETILAETITPTLTKLKEEKSQYLEYQKVQRELEHLTKLYIAHSFIKAQDTFSKAKDQYKELTHNMDSTKEDITRLEGEIVQDDEVIIELQHKRDTEMGGKLKELEADLADKQKVEVKHTAQHKAAKDSIKDEQKKKNQVEKHLKEDQGTLEAKEKVEGKLKDHFTALKEGEKQGQEALEKAQKRFQAVSSGLLANDDGEDATLAEQLMGRKQAMTQAETEQKQGEIKLKKYRDDIKRKQAEMRKTEAEFKRDKVKLDKMDAEYKRMKGELSTLNYEEGKVEGLETTRKALKTEVLQLRDKVDSIKSRSQNLEFEYRDPERNFDKRRVKGTLGQLFTIKDNKFATALETACGAKLYNVVVDNENTSKLLISKGQLQTRSTFIPLNKVRGSVIDDRILNEAQKLVGANNVWTALSLVNYDQELTPAMQHALGGTLVCSDLESAKKVTFNPRVAKMSVTLEGDTMNPSGVLSGGAKKQSSSVLLQMSRLREFTQELAAKKSQLDKVEAQINSIQNVAQRYNQLKAGVDVKEHEVELVRQRLTETSHQQKQQEVDNINVQITEEEQRIEENKKICKDSEKKIKEIEYKLKNAQAVKEKAMKDAETELGKCKKAAEESRKKWKEKEQESESLSLEISELKQAIVGYEEQMKGIEEALEQHKKEAEELEALSKEAKVQVSEAQQALKAQRAELNAQNKEIEKLIAKKEKSKASIAEKHLEIKQLEHQVTKSQSEARDAEKKVTDLLKKYEWIAEERQYFGQANSAFDLSSMNIQETGQRIEKLKETCTRLSKSVNQRAMNMLGQTEEQYNDLMKKKRTVENDKAKIEAVITELDHKKNETLKIAWKQVNKDFGSIFSTLLPGTQAKLQPPPMKTVLDGLEVKIAFGSQWKESLAELSGGQRSLVALSLILSLLLFKPAPIYILDEVDAALDLSHTQNIGNMLRTHFQHSQFIIVSLKDGMFNNANVLFKTKFVDGMSTVSRTTQNVSSKRR